MKTNLHTQSNTAHPSTHIKDVRRDGRIALLSAANSCPYYQLYSSSLLNPAHINLASQSGFKY